MMLDQSLRLAEAERRATVRERPVGAQLASPQEQALRVRIVDCAEDLATIADEWAALEDRACAPCFFQSQAWCAHILATHGASSGGMLKPVVATAWLGRRLVALWPLALRNAGVTRLLTGIGAPYDQYAEILVDRDIERDAVVPALFSAVVSARIADGLLLRKVRLTGAAYCLGALGARVVDGAERAPLVRLDPARPFAEFLSGVSAKTRKNLRNYQNRLARLGRLEHRVLTGLEAGPAIIEAFEGRRAWLSTHGMTSEAFRDPHFEEVMRSMARTCPSELGLLAFVLTLDGRAIAVQWGFLRSGRYYAFMSSRDPAYEDYSAGRLHLQHVLEACHRLGVTEVDLMVPAIPYKMTWTDTADPLVDLVMTWTLRGRLVVDLYQGGVRPMLKRLAARLPAAVRRPLFELVNARRR